MPMAYGFDFNAIHRGVTLGTCHAEGLAGTLKGATVAPLSTSPRVERFYGNRLFVVEGPDLAPPIVVTNESVVQGQPVLQSGQFWIHKQGKWWIIRP